MSFLFHLFFQTFYGPVALLLVGMDGGSSGGNAIIQLIILSAGIFSAVTLFSDRAGRDLVKQCGWVMALCALAFASMVWSAEASLTARKAFALTVATMTALAVVKHYGPTRSIGFFTRTLVVTCVMSLIAVIVIPQVAIHQLSDGYELKHAGLWRGVVGHKVSLGMFGGLSFATLICHGKYGVANPAGRGAAALVALACLIGSGAATGIGCAFVYMSLFYLGRWLAKKPAKRRDRLVRPVIIVLLVVGYVVISGTLDKWASVVGRSSDLTGRADYWPYVETFVDQYGRFIGFGYVAGYKNVVGPLVSTLSDHQLGEAHNGYLEMLVAFGRIGATFVIGVYLWFFVRACRLVKLANATNMVQMCFPMAAIGALFITSYVESVILMPQGMWTMVFPLTVAVLVRLEAEAKAQAAALARRQQTPVPSSPYAVAQDSFSARGDFERKAY